ncbi:Peptidoglycan/xylan/chitin deacetylase, PgdA/CDA1 family [Flavobacterium fluvii]|uniref:Peptidoglycan/xylan/chitin deacetylase, PgdA/CDA1 family n=1 Tax=Flavobacterium fluvii TaxID=468056 RepID=A0A1M5FV08_9FLAO|nr:polysaccharide deacetylase family protein [Flavobacterium fluvii]SHF95306.1 Peptidoglycan/xylan/chitin deacetylase, PgdA/CDA1 family [Flavobacterium fluvii]
MKKTLLVLSSFLLASNLFYAQKDSKNWNGKKCAVVLTYDDALNIHLDKVIPALNSFQFSGTFYLIASSPVVTGRTEEWRTASQKGHELGNHTLYHPCDGSLPGREFVTEQNNLSNYTIARAIKEIREANQVLKNIDGKSERTFAYPCGDLKIKDTLFHDYLKNDFVAARGVNEGLLPAKSVDLSNVNSFVENGSTAKQMIAQIEAAEKAGSFIVFLFHGVGGEHPLNVDFEEHQKLLLYLKNREKDIWVTTMVNLGKYIQTKQSH